MSIVAEKCAYVIGVDTHARTHTYAIINTTTGARACCEAFPAVPARWTRHLRGPGGSPHAGSGTGQSPRNRQGRQPRWPRSPVDHLVQAGGDGVAIHGNRLAGILGFRGHRPSAPPPRTDDYPRRGYTAPPVEASDARPFSALDPPAPTIPGLVRGPYRGLETPVAGHDLPPEGNPLPGATASDSWLRSNAAGSRLTPDIPERRARGDHSVHRPQCWRVHECQRDGIG